MTQPPVAARRPKVLTAHGDDRVDEWYWLRERDDPEVVALLEAENSYTKARCAHTAALADALFAEIVARIQETDLSVPVRKGPFLYYGRTVEGQQYAIHCRRPAGEPGQAPGEPGPPGEPVPPGEPGEAPGHAAEQVLLDENELSRGHDFFSLGALAVSPDHGLLAYATDTTGGERHTLRFRDLTSGTDLPDVVEDTYYGLAWANDNATVFYTRPDEAMRPHQLWRHRLGQDPSLDVCVHTEPDEHFYIGVGRTKDDALVLMDISSKVTSEVWTLPADQPEGAFSVVEARRQGIEYA
ncbi:MAG: oligopeptidase B, partial [Acidimicrobiales bacterium]